MAEPTSTTPGCSPGTPADDSVFGSLIGLTDGRVLVGIQLQAIERVAKERRSRSRS
jgi:hypothetical protein